MADKVVTERLSKVAVQLEKVSKSLETTKKPLEKSEMDLEDELLSEDTPAPSTPSEPATKDAIAPPGGEEPDSIDHRVQHIFGRADKRRAIDDNEHEASPKVANIIVTGTDDVNAKLVTNINVADPIKETVVTNIDVTKAPSNGTVTDDTLKTDDVKDGDSTIPTDLVNNTQPVSQKEPTAIVNNDDVIDKVPDDVEMKADDDSDESEDDSDDDDGDGDWVEHDDQPQEFPDVGFPMQIPAYPRQPEFDYRYRTPNSTPQGRRVDHVNAIVLRRCERDRHTGRIPQDEYEAREEAEMALSLGYVLNFVFPFSLGNITWKHMSHTI